MASPLVANPLSSGDTRSSHARNRDPARRLSAHSLKRSKGSVESLHHRRPCRQEAGDASSKRSRRGQPMRVGNVTSGGRLELRPVVRPLYPPSSFPVTPPHSPPQQQQLYEQGWSQGTFSDLSAPETPGYSNSHAANSWRTAARPHHPPRGRSYSLSTVSDNLSQDRGTSFGQTTYTHHGSSNQPAKSPDGAGNLLDVQIPPSQLGLSRWTEGGDPVFIKPSAPPLGNGDTRASHQNVLQHQATGSSTRTGSRESGRFPFQRKPRMTRSAGPASPRRKTGYYEDPSASLLERSYPDAVVTQELETAGGKDGERALVRVSRATGQVMAATSSGLVAQITSPCLLDYDLLSDFFLTYRAFMTASDLLASLITRLAWAMGRSDDFGRIVRVRVFVGLRHWILNYFQDDFVPDLALRVQACDLINDLSRQLKARHDGGAGDLKIIGELKKCWRRTCNLHWDNTEHLDESITPDIRPGGHVGPRTVAPDRHSSHIIGKDAVVGDGSTNEHSRRSPAPLGYREGGFVSCDGGQKSAVHEGVAPEAIDRPRQTRRDSDQSMYIGSCSVPWKTSRKDRPKTPANVNPPSAWAPHRVPSGSLPPSVARSRSRSRTFWGGKQKESLPDLPAIPTRESGNGILNQTSGSQTEAGALIRGIWIAPADTSFDSLAPPSPGLPTDTSSTSSYSWSDLSSKTSEERSSSGSSPGVKRILGSVKRAFAAKYDDGIHHGSSEITQRHSPYASGNATCKRSTQNQLLTSRNRSAMLNGVKSLPWCDALSAKASESYETQFTGPIEWLSHKPSQSYSSAERSAQAPWDQSLELPRDENGRLQSAVTGGSRSIVIMDATGQGLTMPPILTPGDIRAHESHVRLGSRELSKQTVPVGLDLSTLNERGSAISEQHQLPTPPASQTGSASSRTHDTLRSSAFGGRDEELGTAENSTQAMLEDDSDASSAESATEEAHPEGPLPQLKRQPGGNLRNVEHIHSLEHNRPDTFSSRCSEFEDDRPLPGGLRSAPLPSLPSRGSKVVAKKQLSLLNTHSSQPNLRPSFEREVARLAQLPDDDEDDGGIDSALRKLEGGSSSTSIQHSAALHSNPAPASVFAKAQAAGAAAAAADAERRLRSPKSPHREEEIHMDAPTASQAKATSFRPGSRPITFFEDDSRLESMRGSGAGSIQTDQSIPLLERGISGPALRRRQSSSDWLKVSLPPKKRTVEPSEETPVRACQDDYQPESNIQGHMKLNASSSTDKSFLYDDNQDSNEEDHVTQQGKQLGHGDGSFYFDENLSVMSDSGSAVVSHPLRHSTTPPINSRHRHLDPLPPSVRDYLPAHELKKKSRGLRNPPQPFQAMGQPASSEVEPTLTPPMLKSMPEHLPFILGYPSEVLAQQFTLIEKDALSQVDWRELIDLTWKQSALVPETWPKCLDPKMLDHSQKSLGGVDLCIARFNIMVKWAASEIVLCEDPIERAACVIKYIHTAQQCRRLQNWTTMYQITTALVSGDISRMSQTWEHVPAKDKAILKHLETLIMPLRNFHNLRLEMEAGSSKVDAGCIPFLGLFTHDLIYNAQKPALTQSTDPSGGQEQDLLINFDRHRTAAGIVKSLLRMLDASTRYNFEPRPEVLSPCLWMACLNDSELSRRSRLLEP